MSRQCKARVVGTVAVQLVCDQCDKKVWFATNLIGEDPECLEWEAVRQADWQRADDCIVCSNECSQKFWDFDQGDDDGFNGYNA